MNKRKTKILQTEKETYDGINRTINMQFRVTEEELEQVEKRREELGIHNRSAYLRKMALNGICINLNSKELSRASQLLWHTSNNMNQYAKKANATGRIYLEDINEMKELYKELIQAFGKVLQEFNKISEVIQ